MGRKKAPKKNILGHTGQTASVVLQALAASSGAFPPLQSAAGGALYIAKLIQNFRSDTKNWAEFSDYLQKQVRDVIGNLPDNGPVRQDIKESIEQLSSTLERIGKDIEEIQAQSTVSRFLASATHPDKISDMKQHLDEAIKLLTIKMALTTGMDVAAIAVNQSKNSIVEQKNYGMTSKRLERCMEMIGSTITASALPYTTTAGWDDTQACLVGTRRAHIDAVMCWVHATDLQGTQQIFFLADVVGSGKTALAHTIAEQCYYDGVLASTFFFDSRAGRTSPRSFVFNLARDLASRIPQVSHNISLALKADPNLLLSQPVSRLFKTLVFEPLIQSDVHGPLVIVIDALNEAGTAELQNILRTQIPKLPGTFRVFVTSRPENAILRGLGPDIVPTDLAIHESANREDMAIYVDYRLSEIASHHALENWPPPPLSANLLNRAEGLFMWIAAICDYLLSQVCYPDKMLERLLEGMRETQLPPEKKMDNLYSTILEACHWEDIDFVEGYQQVMGVLVVQKMPLTVDALQLLYGSSPRVKAILLPLASLVTGVTSSIHPAQILHSSLREYITLRANGHRHIHPKLPHAHLAQLCLDALNKVFFAKISGCGYLKSKKDSGIPDIDVEDFTDEQWYAVEFWTVHLTQVGKPSSELIQALTKFLSQHLTPWIEVLVSKRLYLSLIPTRKWLQTTSAANLVGYITNRDMLRSLRYLPRRLAEDARHGEALHVIDDLKDMKQNCRRKPPPSDSSDSMPDLPNVSNSSDTDSDSESDSS